MTMIIQEFDQVALALDLPAYGLEAGDVGTVVDITPNGKQFTLEFFNFEGETMAVVPVSPEQVRSLASREVMHARPLIQPDRP
jgi:hypothetical protein